MINPLLTRDHIVTYHLIMENVFKALADPSRRLLLDRLFERDGQTLTQLEAHLPEMTRFGVMKHLRVLESAALVTTRKVGREKRHYLNAVPIRRLHDRWLDKFAAHAAGSLLDLQRSLGSEEQKMTVAERVATIAAQDDGADATVSRIFQILIRTTPEKLWQALTESEFTTRYYFGAAVESNWQPGSPYTMTQGDNVMITGEVIEANPPRRLVTTFNDHWDEERAARDPSRVTHEIAPMGDVCKLTILHENLPRGAAITTGITDGWTTILSSLKSLLETGQPLMVGAAGE